MEQEKHLTEQAKPKVFFTRSTARHLRRKRLKDARRAEKQSSEFINSVNNNSNETTNDDLNENNKTEGIQQRLTIKSENLSKLSQSSDSLDLSRSRNKVQNQCDYHNGSTSEIEWMSSRTANINQQVHLQLSEFLEDSKRENRVSQSSQTKNDERKKHKNSSVISATLRENPSNTLSCTISSNNVNYNCNYPTIATLDLNSVEDIAENKKNFELNNFSSIVGSDSSRNFIKIKDNEIKIQEDHFVSHILPSNVQGDVTTKETNIRSDLIVDFNDEKTDKFLRETISSIKMADSQQNPPEKTRKEIKAEREARKAAKAAAKTAKTKINKLVDNIKNKSLVAENSEIPKQLDMKTDVVADTQSSHLMKEVKSKENAVLSSIKSTQQNSAHLEGKSKAELRAERRAKQEAQRAAKQQQQSSAKNNTLRDKEIAVKLQTDNAMSECSNVKKSVKKNVQVKENEHEINLFKHLYHEREAFDLAIVNSSIHPAIIRLGIQYASKTIVGSNARCVALLIAIKRVIEDFEKPAQADFIRGLEASLKKSLAYLRHCRPLAVSMQNAMHHLKWQMTQFSSTLSDEETKKELKEKIDIYIKEQIDLADKAISLKIQSKISNGNVILTYGYSSLIHKILVEAHAAGKQFRVVVVDGRPWLEGKEQLRRLAKHGIECSYILINALSFVMPEVNKVFLGAHAILANGAVMSRVGTAQVALMAKAFNVPVLVACETHKSCERVQTDSIVYNELGNADELVNSYQSNHSKKSSQLINWRTRKSLNLLNITYDVTPADLITAVVTELAIVPCTSVPVILRIKPSEI